MDLFVRVFNSVPTMLPVHLFLDHYDRGRAKKKSSLQTSSATGAIPAPTYFGQLFTT
jgi:hypothetical protein